jgi:hypothetical protein
MDIVNAGPKITPACPKCGGRDIDQMVTSRTLRPVAFIEGGEPQTQPPASAVKWEVAGYQCHACRYDSWDLADFLPPDSGR